MSDALPAKWTFPTLSSASSSSSLDQKLAGKSSCPGSFLHLLDWNCHFHKGRLFGHKPLPAGQTISLLKDGTDITEVLPSQNISLISVNTNRGGFPPALETGREDELQKVQTPEKRKKRTPNVVAKLMGLETMPSPEPCRRVRRPLDVQDPNLLCTPEENTYISNSRGLLIRRKSHELDRNISCCSSGAKLSKKDLLHDLSLRQGNENETTGSKHIEAQMQPLRIVPVVHSHEKTRVEIPAAKSMPAGGNIENRQENKDERKFRKLPAARSVKIQGPSLHLHIADTAAQSGMKKDKEPMNVQVLQRVYRPRREYKMVAVQTSTVIATSREEVIRQPIMLLENANNNKSQGKCHLSQQDPSLTSVEKVKPDLKRQEQTCRRLSQIDREKNQISRSGKAKLKMDACPLNADMARPESHDNQREMSASSTMTTVQHDSGSCGTSSFLKHKRLSSSARDARDKEGIKIKVQKTGTARNLSPYVKSSVSRRGNAQVSRVYEPKFEKTLSLKDDRGRNQPSLVAYNEGTLDASSIAEESDVECSSANHLYSRLAAVRDCEDPSRMDNTCIPMLQDNSDVVESAITCGSSITCDGFYCEEMQGTSIHSKHCTFQDGVCTEEVAAGSSLNVLGVRGSTCQSSCKSTIEDFGDTASSFETRNQKQSVSYSGKSTATILKELLMALNPSTKQFIVKDTPEEDRATSGIDDFRISKTTGSSNIDYSKEQRSNYYADSASNNENIFLNTCTIKVLSDGRHSLKECNDSCWQPSLNSALVLPIAYGSSINLERFLSVQETEGRGQDSCRQLTDSKLFAHDKIRSSLSGQIHANTLANVGRSEEDYVKHVVSNSNLSLSEIYSARLLLCGSLIESALFHEIEENFQHQWKWGIQHEHEDEDVGASNKFMGFPFDGAATMNRKLVFDCIGEAVKFDIGVNEQESLQNKIPFFYPSSPESCSRRIQRQINDWRDMSCGLNVDDMVEKEMNSGIGKWVDFPSEVYQIAVDVEVSILKGLIDELVLALSTLVPINMSCENRGLAKKAHIEKHFWVGF